MRKAAAAVYGQEPSLSAPGRAEEGDLKAMAPPAFLPNAAMRASVVPPLPIPSPRNRLGKTDTQKLLMSQGSILTILSLSALRSGGCSNCTERAALRRSSSQLGNHMAICGKASTSTTQMTWITMKSAMPR